jgi:hypothetical protein
MHQLVIQDMEEAETHPSSETTNFAPQPPSQSENANSFQTMSHHDPETRSKMI